MNLEALIFDVDGTLADTEEIHRQAFNAAFQEHGLPWTWGTHEYAALLRISGGKERMRAHLDGLGLDRDERKRIGSLITEIHATKTRLFAALIETGAAPLRPGIARLIREAHASGLKLAIASTTTPGNIDALLGRNLGDGAVGWFSVIAAGDQVPEKKPAPDIYHLALRALGVPPSACVAFEDSDKGLKAAKAAGLFTVVTPTLWTASEDFSAADLVLPSLGEPEAPLDPGSSARIGAPFVTLGVLEALHAAARPEAPPPE